MASNFGVGATDPSSPGDNRLKIEFFVDREDPNLLVGLEHLLQLGILSDRQVLLLAKQSLACQCNSIPVIPKMSNLAPDLRVPVEVAPVSQALPSSQATVTPEPNVLTALMAEISVVWLLFLGVFLVVVSSAALAAIQWRYFSAVGQYGILWLYTLTFGGVGLWTGQRDNLKLTGRMLKIAALLIIPVNFWMMDGFALWQSGNGWMMIAIATASLLVLQTRLLKNSSPRSRWNIFLLNGLQWGWSLAIVPLLFTYIGTIATAFVQAIAQRSRNTNEDGEPELLPAITIAFATFLLIGRAILIRGVPLSRFGLAIAMIGWLIYWLNRSAAERQQILGVQAGAALLGLGWLVSYSPDRALVQAGFDPLWQTLAISGLAIGVLLHHLHHRWEKATLFGLWAIGLQTYTIARVVIPNSTRQSIMTWVADWANLQTGAWALTGLGLFGYVLISLGFASYLRRRNQERLANLTEGLTFILGVGLALPSLVNPLVRSIYFSLSAILLITLWLHRRTRNVADEYLGNLVYLLHTSSAIAVVSWILWLFPKLSTQQWAWILILGAILEWAFVAVSCGRFWQNSAWLLGLAQATCAYPLLLSNLSLDGQGADIGLPWLMVPIGLTSLAYMPRFRHRMIAIVLSVSTVGLSLILMFTSVNASIITLGLSTVVLFANSIRGRQLYLAALTLGLGLAYLGVQTWQLGGQPAPEWCFVGLAIALWLVWIIRDLVDRWGKAHDAETEDLSYLYAVAANGWGRGLGIFIGWFLGSLVAIGSIFPASANTPWSELLLAGGLSYGAIIYRVWQAPTNLGLWGLAIGAEILVNLVAEFINAPFNYRIIVTLLFGIGTVFIGAYWRRQNPDRPTWTAFNGVPGAYAVLVLMINHGQFSQLTGLYTVIASLIFILLGRRTERFIGLSYLGLAGVTIGAYEWVFYILSRSSGDSFGDSVTILAAVSAALAFFYQILRRSIDRIACIPVNNLATISLIHWIIGSLLGATAWFVGLSDRGVWIWLGIQALLTIVILWQGRRRSGLIYFGFGQSVWTIAVLLNQLLPFSFLQQWGSIFASIASFAIFSMNWERWGWARQPWHHSATVLPATIAIITANQINIPALLLTSAFYGSYAWKTEQIRLSYIGLGLAVWGLFRWLVKLNITDPYWYAAILCLAILFIVGVDPDLQGRSAKATRHLIRCFALGIFCTTLFYDSWEVAWQRGLFTMAITFGLSLLGLLRRTRAYLYVGTVTFIFSVLRILWLYVSDYSLLLWAVGIAIGLGLIWVAATFEARRSQAIALVEYWLRELTDWE